MHIRRLDPADATAYRTLRLRALQEHPEAFTSSHDEDVLQPPEQSAQRLAGPRQRFWGAWEGDALTGMVGLERLPRAKERHKAIVVGMYVAPEHAGRGIGRQLLEALLADARTQGLEQLVLTVTDGNAGAVHLYERAGFRSFGVEPRAIRVEGRFFAKNHMALALGSSV